MQVILYYSNSEYLVTTHHNLLLITILSPLTSTNPLLARPEYLKTKFPDASTLGDYIIKRHAMGVTWYAKITFKSFFFRFLNGLLILIISFSVLNYPVAESKTGPQTVDALCKRLESLKADKVGTFSVDCETYHCQLPSLINFL